MPFINSTDKQIASTSFDKDCPTKDLEFISKQKILTHPSILEVVESMELLCKSSKNKTSRANNPNMKNAGRKKSNPVFLFC